MARSKDDEDEVVSPVPSQTPEGTVLSPNEEGAIEATEEAEKRDAKK